MGDRLSSMDRKFERFEIQKRHKREAACTKKKKKLEESPGKLEGSNGIENKQGERQVGAALEVSPALQPLIPGTTNPLCFNPGSLAVLPLVDEIALINTRGFYKNFILFF